MNIFERAARQKLCFNVRNGIYKVENLFDLNLEEPNSNKVSLDVVACDIDKELTSLGNVSFVNTKPNPRKVQLELQLEIVKHIIASKQADALAAKTRAETIEKKRKIIEVLAEHEGEALKKMTPEQLRAQLAALGGE